MATPWNVGVCKTKVISSQNKCMGRKKDEEKNTRASGASDSKKGGWHMYSLRGKKKFGKGSLLIWPVYYYVKVWFAHESRAGGNTGQRKQTVQHKKRFLGEIKRFASINHLNLQYTAYNLHFTNCKSPRVDGQWRQWSWRQQKQKILAGKKKNR